MFGDQRRLKTRNCFANALQMRGIDAAGASWRQRRSVQRQLVIGANAFQKSQTRPAAEIVLGMNLKPSRCGPGLGDKSLMRETQPDSGMGRKRAALLRLRGRM